MQSSLQYPAEAGLHIDLCVGCVIFNACPGLILSGAIS
jgi:hypothetical protein